MELTIFNISMIVLTDKNHPFHLRLDERTKTTGVVLRDQTRTLDINARNYVYIEDIPDDTLFDVIDIVSGFFEMENKTSL